MALVAQGRVEEAVTLLREAGLVAEAEQLSETHGAQAAPPAPESGLSPRGTSPASQKRPGRDLPPVPRGLAEFGNAQTLQALEVPKGAVPPVSRRARTQPRLESTAATDPPPSVDFSRLPQGFIVAGRYRIEARLGTGGMAAVYRAVDMERGETVAIKLASSAADPELLSRFEQELALCQKISHDNVIRLFEVGSHGASSSDELCFVTMELLVGSSLFDLLGDSRDLVRDLGYLIQICQAMHCVHKEGLVHRDVKPENIFVTSAGRVKLMDFGLAKRRGTSSGRTQTGFALGTPAYMAPEQVRDSAAATHLSDLYSIGVMAYQMFTGVLPFISDSVEPLLLKQLKEVPKPPSFHDRGIPEGLDYLILQLLEKEPARRVQSCRDLAEDLDALRRRLMAARNAPPSRPSRPRR